MKSLLLLTLATLPALTSPQPRDLSSARRATVGAVEEFLQAREPGLEAFVRERVAAGLRAKHSVEVLAERLGRLHAALRDAELDDLFPDNPRTVCMSFVRRGEPVDMLFQLEADPPHAIVDVWIEHGLHLDPDAVETRPIRIPVTWDTLEERMAAETEAGFSGAVLVQRDGQVVLRAGYGPANREEGHPVTPGTVFGIGSTPIDFTRAGILLLEEAGALSREDPITAYFDDVPPDKQALTLRHLTTGGSGLQDFHDVPADRDKDHSWIDRDEAVRRILAQELLFAPGTGRAHSHSAWGLLAAVLEIVSGQSYQEFTRENLFEPLGMESTGFNGETWPVERLAIGYGERSDGEVNAPPWWGPTSWLVMGSGGMVSTLDDMHRWLTGMRAGKVLSPEALRDYWAPPGALATGGDMYGFEIYYNEGPGSLMLLLSNGNQGARRRATKALARELFGLVQGRATREATAPR